MRVAIRAADLERDRCGIVELVRRHLSPAAGDERFEWLYLKNPHGVARAWLAIDEACGVVVGVGAAFPRRLYLGDTIAEGWVLGDFCLEERYRTLGPALQLQRAILGAVDGGTVSFCYDFPNGGMAAVLRRLGVSPKGEFLRMVLPLRMDRQIRARLGSGYGASVVNAVGNLGLRLMAQRLPFSSSVEVDREVGLCRSEFSALSEEIAGRRGVCVQRSAEYVNWRYLANPVRRHHLLSARQGGRLRAFAVYTCDGHDAVLQDLFGCDDPAVLASLVSRIVGDLLSDDIMGLNVHLLSTHPLRQLFESLGFRLRESSPVMWYWAKGITGWSDGVFPQPVWIMQGDRDS